MSGFVSASWGRPVSAPLRSLVYVSKSRLPSAEANAVHVALMCDAFAALVPEVRLRARKGRGDAVSHYRLTRDNLQLDFESKSSHLLWMAGRFLGRLLARRADAIYYGRRLTALAQLARWGYPVAVELHKPPRKAAHQRDLEDLIRAPGFCGLVVISERLRQEMLRLLPGVSPDRVLVAHDGFRADRVHEPVLHERPRPQAVYCGSMYAGKGADAVVDAAGACPGVDFCLIGGTPAQVEALQVRAPANIRFLGHLQHSEVLELLPEFDFALAPYGRVVRGVRTPDNASLADWMSPLKVFEYAAAGLPIVTSDLPVLRELLSPQVSALMVTPDDKAELVSAINRMAAEPGMRLLLARNAQAMLAGYSWQQRAGHLLAFLESERVRGA